MNKALFLRVKTILLAQTWISIIVYPYVLQKETFSLHKTTISYLLSLFFYDINPAYTLRNNTQKSYYYFLKKLKYFWKWKKYYIRVTTTSWKILNDEKLLSTNRIKITQPELALYPWSIGFK